MGTRNGKRRLAAAGLAVSAMIVLAAAGCSSVRRGEPIAGAMRMTNPQIENGRVLFMMHCHQCHPGGEGGLGPGINDKPLPSFLMKTQVRAGLGVMPAFGKHQLNPEELDELVAYLRALRKHGR